MVAIDARKREDGSGWNIYKNGGRVDVGIDAIEWAKKVESLGAGEIDVYKRQCYNKAERMGNVWTHL